MSDGFGSLRVLRARVEAVLAERGLLHTLSAARFQLKAAVEAAISEFAHGQVLEAGAGRSPYMQALEAVSTSITTLDVSAERHPDIVGDV